MAQTKFSGPVVQGDDNPDNIRGWHNLLPVGCNPDVVTFMDDFTNTVFNATDDWTSVVDASATVTIEADTGNGSVLLTSAATTDNNGASIQGNEVFLPAAGKVIWFEARIKASSAADHDTFIGLCENFITAPANCLAAANRIGFQIDDGSASILCKSEVATVETSTASGVSQVNATFITVGFRVQGLTKIDFYVNRAKVATHTSVPTTELALAYANVSGSATGTHTAHADYVFAAVSRT